MTRNGLIAVVVLALTPAMAFGAVLFSSDMSTATGWGTVATSGDDVATFGYDYSAMGISAPPGGGDTIGLHLAANTAAGAAGGITAYSDLTFSGTYTVEFDTWGNYDTVSGGTSEFFGGGVAHDQATVNRAGVSGSGSHLTMTTDGFSSRDYRMYKNASEQWVASTQYNNGTGVGQMLTNNGNDANWALVSPSIDISTFDPPQSGQTGIDGVGNPAFTWLHVKLTVVPDASPNGWVIMEVGSGHVNRVIGWNGSAGTAPPMSGAISLFHFDTYGSVAGAYGFSIFDNIVVTDVPEPATLALLGLGGLAFLRRRR